MLEITFVKTHWYKVYLILASWRFTCHFYPNVFSFSYSLLIRTTLIFLGLLSLYWSTNVNMIYQATQIGLHTSIHFENSQSRFAFKIEKLSLCFLFSLSSFSLLHSSLIYSFFSLFYHNSFFFFSFLTL